MNDQLPRKRETLAWHIGIAKVQARELLVDRHQEVKEGVRGVEL